MMKRYKKFEKITVESRQNFTEDMLRLKASSPRREYYSRKKHKEIKYAVHWGQRKLLMSEIEFLTFFWNPRQVTNPIIVYAGAAGGQHIPVLVKMFPQISSLHLYDPNPFAIHPSEKITIYQELFTDEIAKNWSGRDDIFFISDIRTADYHKMKPEENEKTIIKDMNLQRRWVEIMKPVNSLLKFRLPYPYVKDKSLLKLKYLNGYIFFQPWAGASSTETRLVPTKSTDYNYTVWDAVVYEEQLFYHNTVNRNQELFLNPFHKDMVPIDGSELLNDWDSLAELTIIQSYLKKFKINVNEDECLKLSRWITKTLCQYLKVPKTIQYLREQSIKNSL
jgi:hypothetical protein